ncbi:Zn-dependent hydrolase [Rhizobium sp. SL86]|uniref:Zn-dependent hydrolase n=1 Tax=Rhizobium sp. SL86 TaxID=2995148 RepID=UPI0022754729|nr:Zn-dependent hydrolase [Rhizobium sp. SL86]MCY1666655.1 Zn-dependent hydrolase [Rhizobium sp. SL86]
MGDNIAINGERLLANLQRFAEIGATPKGGVNRQALTDLDRQARRRLAELAAKRGFSVFQDEIANLFIRREGRNPALPPMLIGSHLDSQPLGGKFDGALGTLAAFEVLETLEDHGIETERPVEVVAFTNEEGCRFAPGCMGSMAFAAGELPASWQDLRAVDGASLADELAATLASLPEATMRPLGFPVFAYLEVHIEQGRLLESEALSIGIVTGIQGTRWLDVELTGQTAHAGTTLLKFRRDPMRVAVQALAGLYDHIMPSDERARFTVGRMSLKPGAVNAIPESVRLTIDIRHPETPALDAMEQIIRDSFARQAGEQDCQAIVTRIFDMPPAEFPSTMADTLSACADRLQLGSRRMLSGAFHDALFMNRIAPAAMIFVPCRDGLSHNELEHVEPDHSIAGCRLLAAAVLDLCAS